MKRRAAILIAAVASMATQAAASEILFARGRWAALRSDAGCQAASRPLPPASTREKQSRAAFAFGNRRHGEFQARLSRVPRAGSSVLMKVGTQPFLLVARGPFAWSRGPSQDAAIIAAMRRERAMRIEARDERGRRFADLYPLAGAPTAIDAAAAGCAGKI